METRTIYKVLTRSVVSHCKKLNLFHSIDYWSLGFRVTEGPCLTWPTLEKDGIFILVAVTVHVEQNVRFRPIFGRHGSRQWGSGGGGWAHALSWLAFSFCHVYSVGGPQPTRCCCSFSMVLPYPGLEMPSQVCPECLLIILNPVTLTVKITNHNGFSKWVELERWLCLPKKWYFTYCTS